MDSFEVYLQERADLVEAALDEYLPGEEEPPGVIHRAMRYSVFNGGKRLRPILCLAAAEAVGGDYPAAMPAACALELIHTYSLIHDDLPAMDNDDLRRGEPTSHVKFGEAIAILAGDALLTEAFVILSRATAAARGRHREKLIAATARIAAAASCRGMIAGQVIDIKSEGKKIDGAALERLQRLKTGELITASVCSGGILGGAGKRQLNALIGYSQAVGLAFQVVDDILNATGDSRVMGKRTGTDAARGKATFVGIMGLEEAQTQARNLTETALKCLEGFDRKAEPLRQTARFVLERKK